MIILKGDVLIDRKTLRKFPVLDVIDGHVYMELGYRRVKRAIGQIIKHQKKFIHLRVGETIPEDYAFYCPKAGKMIIIPKGTLFLGEL